MTPVCAIIGAGQGLSAGIARRFGREGFDIALVSRSGRPDPHLEGSRAFQGDASSDAIASTFEEITAWRRSPDVLIYNSAAMVSGDVTNLTPRRVAEEMETTLFGALRSVDAVLPTMRERKAGTILFTGGGLALEPYPEWASLAAGKAALRAYAIALHKALAPDGIRVAIVAVCGLVKAGTAFDPDRIADIYWRLHADSALETMREVVYLPQGADPYYNDPERRYRSTSLPIEPLIP